MQNTRRRLSVLYPVALLAQACSLFPVDPADRCGRDDHGVLCSVSLVELISRPEIYSDRRVQVSGWLHLEFEGDALYLHREDFERSIPRNAISFSAPEEFMVRAAEFNDHYCVVVGTFVAHEAGTLEIVSGGLRVEAVLRLPEARAEWETLDTIVEWRQSP
jgi:hypothetical protein